MWIREALSSRIQKTVTRFLKHTYTYISNNSIPGDPPTYDEWGNQIFTDAAPITGKQCLFLYEDVLSETEQGAATIHTPTLYVLHNDPVIVGDLVQNVQSRNGTVLLASAIVESIDFTAEGGDATVKVLRLSGANTVSR